MRSAKGDHSLLARASPNCRKSMPTIQCIGIDCAAGQESGLIRAEQSKKGRSIATPDALIAGHARHAGLVLVTDNTRHFDGIARLKTEPQDGELAHLAARR